jgi:hypothetical protein
MGRSKTTLVLMVAIASAVAVSTTFASAAPNAKEDGADTFNVAKGTAVRGTNSGTVIFSASTSAGTITVSCSLSTFSGKTGTILTVGIAPPIFGNAAMPACKDSLGFTDTFKSNSLNGKWSLTEKDFTNKGTGDEGLPEPNATGDTMVIIVPKAGLVDSNSSAPGCTITFAPSGAAHVRGKYNDGGALTIKSASIPVSATGCPVTGTTATVTVTYNLSPAIFDIG